MKLSELKAAYLLENADMETAKKIVCDLLCENSDARVDFDKIKGGCGHCRSCNTVLNESNPNLLIINSKKAVTIDEVRSIREFFSLKLIGNKDGFVLIDCAPGINEEAQNAALKLFEEPPMRTHFILVGIKREELLATVCSRLVIIENKLNKQNTVDENLEKLILSGNYEDSVKYTKNLSRKEISETLIELARKTEKTEIFDKLIESAINISRYNCNQKIALFDITKGVL